MRNQMKNLKRIIIISIIVILFITANCIFAADTTEIENYIKENNLNANSITASDVITMYQDLSKEYSNEEIANMIDEYSGELEKNGVSSEVISTGTTLLTSTDAQTLNEVLDDVNVEEIKEKLDNGASAEEIINDVKNNMTTTQKVSTASKLLLSNKIIKTVFTVWVIYVIYMILIRGIIYKKAGEHFFATFIPFYRDAVLFKMCGYSSWWLLLLLIPIIGWFIYAILKIIMNFELSAAFGKGAMFGIGLWLLKPIFESVMAFSKKLQFIEIEE